MPSNISFSRFSRRVFVHAAHGVLAFAVLAGAVVLPTVVQGQAPRENWQTLDLAQDSVFGVSVERAYRELLGTTKATPVIVGVIDAGIDTAHEDLRHVLWHNPQEVADNKQDDDHDGFVDDVVGWNLTGAATEHVRYGMIEATQRVRAWRPKYGAVSNSAQLSAAERDTLAQYRRLLSELAPHGVTTPPTPRGGDADVTSHALHGTHVAGIIAAQRHNDIGINGIADAVQLMAVRVHSLGNERDEDIASAIRYAVDHGAKVINMSVGGNFSENQPLMDAVVKYAMSKDVLIVHAAGNDGHNVDRYPFFPNRIYEDGSGEAKAWLEVGASGWRDDVTLVAPFSNYGKTGVDVFAPGVLITSTLPHGDYGELSGTSMAAPVVTGVAALIRSRYPQLTAVQVKDIIMQSVTKVTHPVIMPGEGPGREPNQGPRVPFSDLCRSGGIVNAYNALKLAATYNSK
jgi:subtilisin family serine protease